MKFLYVIDNNINESYLNLLESNKSRTELIKALRKFIGLNLDLISINLVPKSSWLELFDSYDRVIYLVFEDYASEYLFEINELIRLDSVYSSIDFTKVSFQLFNINSDIFSFSDNLSYLGKLNINRDSLSTISPDHCEIIFHYFNDNLVYTCNNIFSKSYIINAISRKINKFKGIDNNIDFASSLKII